MGASGCCSGSVVRCSCSCLPACCVLYRAVSCRFCGWRVGAAVRCPEVRIAWLVLWRRGVPSGAAGWARRNTPVFAGMSRRARGSRMASSWPLACTGRGPEERNTGQCRGPPLVRRRCYLSGLQGVCPSDHSRRLHVPKPPQHPRRLPFSEEVRAGPSGARIPSFLSWKVTFLTTS